jgi:hypothetical protein
MAGGKIILKYRNDPAILCWKSHDETDGWIDLNRETYNMYKNLDPYRPVYLNLINAVPSNKDNADILSTDPYPIGKALITKVSVHVDILRKVLGERPDQSYWVVLQIFGSPVEKWPRCPTPQEERCMTFLALNHGAKGLSYFAYNPEITRKEGGHKFLSEELWQSMKELNRQTKQMSLPYLIGKKISGVSSDRNEIDLAAIEYKGVVYIIACNTIDSQVNAEIKLPSGKKPEKADVEFEERDVPVENGFIKDAFSPYAVHIYKYENR